MTAEGFRVVVEPDREVWAWSVTAQRNPFSGRETPGDHWPVLLPSRGLAGVAEGTERTEEKARKAARRALGEAAAERAIEVFDDLYRASARTVVTVP